jgi:hypothetical protein
MASCSAVGNRRSSSAGTAENLKVGFDSDAAKVNQQRRHRHLADSHDVTCWSASASMVLGNQSAGPGNALLDRGGALEPNAENVEVFARGLGWRMFYPMSWTACFRRSPSARRRLGIYDPWPPKEGKVYGRFYKGTVAGFDFISCTCFNRRITGI